ncbi:hypothetical protein VTO73DRAFT_7805 [Trametes versicolor]
MNLGAILIGCIIQAMFYGNMFSLAWRYYTAGRGGDPLWFRVSIGLAWFICTFSVAVSVHGLWFFVVEFLFQKCTEAPWTVDFYLLINSIVATLVRLLYVYRLGKLCRTSVIFRGRALAMILLGLTVILCVVEMAASATISSRLYVTDTALTGREGPYLRPIFYLLFASGWSANLILTGIMCLWLHSARTGLHRTDSVINNMIVYTLETGLFPSLIETIGMITFIVAPERQVYIAFYIQIGLLYLSSLLTSLNKRQFVQGLIRKPLSLNFSILNDASINREPSPTDRGHSITLTDGQPPDLPYMKPAYSPGERSEEKAVSLVGVERPQTEPHARVGARPRAATMPGLRLSERQTWIDSATLY